MEKIEKIIQTLKKEDLEDEKLLSMQGTPIISYEDEVYRPENKSIIAKEDD